MPSLLNKPYEWFTALTWSKKSIQDLKGYTILVTGGYNGVGYEAAKAFAQKNAHVIIMGRNAEKGERAVEAISKVKGPEAKVEFMECDLTSFKSIKAFVEAYVQKGYPLTVLLNNAGIQAPWGERCQLTVEGFEQTMGTNHFGPTLLTMLLLPVIKVGVGVQRTVGTSPIPPRIVWVSSIGSQLVNPPYIGSDGKGWGIDWMLWSDLTGAKRVTEQKRGSDWWCYSRTKLMNIMMCKEMARRLAGTGIESFVCHPGLSPTDHFGKADTSKWSSWLIEFYANSLFGHSPEHAAIPLEYASTAHYLTGKSGAYIGGYQVFPMINYLQAQTMEPNPPLARNPEACARLYNMTMEILRQKGFPDLPAAWEASGCATTAPAQATF